MNPFIAKLGAFHALLTAAYIACVSALMFYGFRLFGTNTEDTIFAPIAMLLLFVTSAAITGSLVLGRPILWYLDGKKKEAVLLLGATLAALFCLTVLAFAVNLLLSYS